MQETMDAVRHSHSMPIRVAVRTPRKLKATKTSAWYQKGAGVHIQPQMDSQEHGQSMPVKTQKTPSIRKKRNYLTRLYRSILYGKISSTGSSADEKDHPRSDAMCAILLVIIIIGSTSTILYYQFAQWPHQTSTYTTNNPRDNFRGGSMYTCGCSLPPNLQGAENPQQTKQLKLCHEPSELETVTVLMFSDSVVETLQTIQVLEESSSPSVVSKTVNDGFEVTQEAHDITLLTADINHSLEADRLMAPLYVAGVSQRNKATPVEYLLSSEFLEFPSAYMRMAWIYNCNNCTKCGLDVVNSLTVNRAPANESERPWVSCFYYGNGANRCSANNGLQAKCLLYPTEELPPIFAVQGFMTRLVTVPGISSIRDIDTFDNQSVNKTERTVQLDSGILYLNISEATSRPTKLSFMEVDRGSVTWALLSRTFTQLDECTNLSPVRVCNSTSVCNVFGRASTYDLGCIHFTSYNQCQPLATYGKYGLFSPDNVENYLQQGMQLADIVCPKALNCITSSPYLVSWDTAARMKRDPLNSFLKSRIVGDEWTQRSGVCTNTYENVFRYAEQPVEGTRTSANETATLFLHANCSNSTPTQPSYCWLTGLYHNLSDSPGERWKRLPDDLFRADSDRFACYRVEAQAFSGWFIVTFGILFGWIGTIQLVFYASFYWFFVPARRFLLDRPKLIPMETGDGDQLLLLDRSRDEPSGSVEMGSKVG